MDETECIECKRGIDFGDSYCRFCGTSQMTGAIDAQFIKRMAVVVFIAALVGVCVYFYPIISVIFGVRSKG